ncbi:hypothetical protein VNO77_22335 [Canavalia gladiata]|uniref:FAS1 domain-containing protein n=1 Tax=Canavalia gladiata TaxID=3824 RepID=A0AAN9QED1_CANGL
MKWIAWVVVLLAMANAVSVRSIPSRELDSMLDTLRVRGYDLFCNAIVTSDLQMELLSYQRDANSSYSFTFFAPTDASLFALDMTQTASSYTDTLRFHIVPRRLSFAHLRLLPEGYLLPTLLLQRRLQLTRRPLSSAVSVGGVDIAFPGLFYGRNVAVHGLAGILSLRSNNPPSPAPVFPPIRSADHRFYSPRRSPNPPENQPVSPLPVEARAPGASTVTRQAPASSTVNGMVDEPEREFDWTVLPPANLGDSPVASPPRNPDWAISLPPEGYSDSVAPTPGTLNGIRKCVNPDVGLKESIAGEHARHMQCYAA